ncbi:MAG: hypothetical protein EOM52_09450 [Clostridia bacterium]|nr:hypothetical protein [Clostridia bacterium]
MKSRLIPTFILTVLLLTLSASAAQPDFPDVSTENWAYSDIQKAAEYGLMQGLQDGTFGPETRLDRASFVTILSRMFAWDLPSPAAPSFPDVPSTEWFYGAVEAAKAHGVTGDETLFRPKAYISREEMSVMLIRALGYDTLAGDLAAKGSVFPDVTTHPGHIAVAYAIGMTTGIQNVKTGVLEFQPTAFATRGQAASMLVRVYERYTSKISWLNGFYAFSSFSQINLTAKMDAVSVGWAQLSWDDAQGAWLNSTSANGNDWVKPQDVTPATGYFQGNGTPYHLNVFATTTKNLTLADGSKTSVVDRATSTPEGRAQAISAITAASADYAGITIDFEGLKGDAVKADFVTFLTELRAALPQGKTLYVCVQPDTWYTGFDYRGIGDVADKVILMAHDYQWTSVDASYMGAVMGGPKTSSPVTPFPDLFEALADITDPAAGVQDRSKIALQISFGTAGFKVDAANRLLDTTIYHPAQDTIAKRLKQADTAVVYDGHSRNPIATYSAEDGSRYMLWYEDARSVKDKLDLARMFGISGVSIWRIGIIPTDAAAGIHYDVWSAIQSQR